jgi:ABC-type transport system involved in multi-copper enzyme maturation permease subunit
MLGTLIQKELRAILQSPKFVGAFAVCSVLILLSVFTGVQEYKAAERQYQTATALVDQQLRESTGWNHLDTKTYRAPDPMQIFVSGLSNDIGRWSTIGTEEGVKLRHSAYSDDPIFAVFRFVDFAFIMMFVLSLIAIQFTYDAVNGERESGTLKLVFSNAVSRATYLVAKCAGSWLGLAAPLSIPILASLLLVIVMGVPLTGVHWLKIAILIGLSLLLFTFFIVLGVMVSTMTRRSSVSFLIALLVWVGFVMIIPRAGVMAAGGLVDIPRVAEIEAQRNAFANEKWAEFYADLSSGKWMPEEGEGHDADVMTFSSDSAQEVIDAAIEEYDARLRENYRQRKTGQEQLAWTLSRLSPASAYQLAAMTLTQTDTRSKGRYEDAMTAYREQFNDYVAVKEADAGDMGGIRISVSMEEGQAPTMQIDASRDRDVIDISDVPRFAPPEVSLAEAISPIILDIGLLCLYIMLAFVAAFVALVKYDVR